MLELLRPRPATEAPSNIACDIIRLRHNSDYGIVETARIELQLNDFFDTRVPHMQIRVNVDSDPAIYERQRYVGQDLEIFASPKLIVLAQGARIASKSQGTWAGS